MTSNRHHHYVHCPYFSWDWHTVLGDKPSPAELLGIVGSSPAISTHTLISRLIIVTDHTYVTGNRDTFELAHGRPQVQQILSFVKTTAHNRQREVHVERKCISGHNGHSSVQGNSMTFKYTFTEWQFNCLVQTVTQILAVHCCGGWSSWSKLRCCLCWWVMNGDGFTLDYHFWWHWRRKCAKMTTTYDLYI